MIPLPATVAALVLASTAACATGAQDPPPEPAEPPPPYVPNQVIVAFHDGSTAAAAARSARSGTGSSRLEGYVTELGDRLGIPLEVRRLTSGEAVLIGIDLPRLAEKTAETLLDDEAIAGAETVPSERPGPPTAMTLRLALTGEPGDALAAAWSRDAESDERLDALVDSARRRLDLPLAYRIDGEREVLVEVDLLRLTETLAAKLGEMDDVEYAELDQIMEPMGVGDP